MPLDFEYTLLRLHEAILYPETVDNETLRNLLNKEPDSNRDDLLWDWLQCVRTLVRQCSGLQENGILRNILFRHYPTSDAIRRLAQEILHDLNEPWSEKPFKRRNPNG